MKIAILSDIHENFHNLILALDQIKLMDVEVVLCLGDLMNAGIANVMSIQDIPVYMIWGNNDGEVVDIVKLESKKGSQLKVSNRTFEFLEFADKKLFLTHYNDLAEPMAKSGLYDAVFYGHDHTRFIGKIDECWVVNPGEISAQKTGTASFAIYDTSGNTVELIELENTVSLKTDLVSKYLSKHKDRLNFRSEKAFKL